MQAARRRLVTYRNLLRLYATFRLILSTLFFVLNYGDNPFLPTSHVIYGSAYDFTEIIIYAATLVAFTCYCHSDAFLAGFVLMMLTTIIDCWLLNGTQDRRALSFNSKLEATVTPRLFLFMAEIFIIGTAHDVYKHPVVEASDT